MLDDVMVRRLKDDIREIQGGFPKRQVVQMDIDGLPPDAPELRLSALLDQYRGSARAAALGRDQAEAGRRGPADLRAPAAAPVVRSRRSPARCASIAARSSASGKRPRPGKPARRPHAGQIDLLAGAVGNDDDRAALAEEELQAEEDAQVAAASAATAGPLDRCRGPAASSPRSRSCWTR